MNVLVVGSGAVGSLLAWSLAAAGLRVWVVQRGTAAPGQRAIVVARPDGTSASAPVGVVGGPAAMPVEPDVVVLAVKAYDVPAAVASLPAWPDATVLTIQNGVGSEEAAMAGRPTGGLIAGSLTAAVELDPAAAVRWRRRGGIGLAGVRGATGPVIERLLDAFSASGLPARRYPDWAAMKWSKLVANLVGNATSALLDRDPASIYRDPRLFAVERAQIREALAVMRRRGLRPVALPGANVPALAFGVAVPAWLGQPVLSRMVGRARGGKAPSLRVHLGARAGPSEAGWMNGAVARQGEALGIPTPVNATLARLLDAAAADPAVRFEFRDRPDRLLEALSEVPGGAAAHELGTGGGP